MDPVLAALKHYRDYASEQQKKADLNRLKAECLSTVGAHEYVYAVTIQNTRHLIQQGIVNCNMNPDYSLDFSLYPKSYGNTCSIRV